MKYLTWIIVLAIIGTVFFDCKQSISHKDSLQLIMNDVDKLNVLYYSTNDTSEKVVRDKSQISIITELIKDKDAYQESICKPAGQILFYNKNKIVLKANFSTGKMNNTDCEYLDYSFDSKHYSSQLTYRAGMLLDNLTHQQNHY